MIKVLTIQFLLTAIGFVPQTTPQVETRYDEARNLTTVHIGPVRLSGDRDRYHSLDFSISHSHKGRTRSVPQRINFELVSVVKAQRLNSDLYVVFLVNGKPIHFSSNRSAIRKPVPGRLWIGERMVFLVPYEEFVKLATAEKLSIKMGAQTFDFDDEARDALHAFLTAAQ